MAKVNKIIFPKTSYDEIERSVEKKVDFYKDKLNLLVPILTKRSKLMSLYNKFEDYALSMSIPLIIFIFGIIICAGNEQINISWIIPTVLSALSLGLIVLFICLHYAYENKYYDTNSEIREKLSEIFDIDENEPLISSLLGSVYYNGVEKNIEHMLDNLYHYKYDVATAYNKKYSYHDSYNRYVESIQKLESLRDTNVEVESANGAYIVLASSIGGVNIDSFSILITFDEEKRDDYLRKIFKNFESEGELDFSYLDDEVSNLL